MDRKGAKTGFGVFFVLFGMVSVGRAQSLESFVAWDAAGKGGGGGGWTQNFGLGRGPNPALLVLDASRASGPRAEAN